MVFPWISSVFDPQAIFSVELLPGGGQAHHKMDCISTTAFIGITHAIGSKIGRSRSCWNSGIEYYPVGMKTHIEYPDIFFENIIVLTALKWARTFSSIYYEQVALLHTTNRLASDETEEFLPEHVPHV